MNRKLGSRQIERIEGLNFARAWREKNRAHFDALYSDRQPERCTCGRAMA